MNELSHTLRKMGVNQGHKKEEEIQQHLNISKKLIKKKWVRSELRMKFGENILISSGANKKVLTKDRNEALW